MRLSSIIWCTTVMCLAAVALGSWLPRANADASKLSPIQIENALPGTRSWKLTVQSYHREIEGYASSPGVEPGQKISFFVSTTGTTFRADIYRMGWYHGDGSRLVKSIKLLPGHLRPMPKPQRGTGLIACWWPKSFSITIPKTWVSGIYLVKLTASNTHQGYIPFTVTSSGSHSTYLFIHGVFTDEAYNTWGGKSLYADINAPAAQQYADRAVNVSLQRPFEQNMGAGWFLSWEVHMVRFLERGGYDVSYTTDLEVHEHPNILLHHKVILVVGHDEYWSHNIRNGMDNAVAHGMSLANFAANTGFWQVRIAPLAHEADRVIVCYKTSHDPLTSSDASLTTTMWRNPPVNRPESELTGAMYGGFDGTHAPYPWIVADSSSWVFQGTHMRNGSEIPSVVGQEADTLVAGYRRPQNLHVLSSSPFNSGGSGHFNANSTLYRAKSGAWVFDAGSIEWSWGLDDVKQSFWLYPAYPNHPNADAQIITRNILARFAR